MQSGGAILGEGVDGCVLAQPTWPCAAGDVTKSIPNPRNMGVVSKVVKKKDNEETTLKLAEAILGHDLAERHLAPLRGVCAPANNAHPPPLAHRGAYQASKSAVLAWGDNTKACGEVKKQLISGKGIHDEYKVTFIDRYPMNLEAWVQNANRKKIPARQVVGELAAAIRPFLVPLQRLYKNPSGSLINIDLHNQNLFVRPRAKGGVGIEFGIADFGHCILEGGQVEYLDTYIKHYEFWAGYNQVPLEARLLNFCFQKRLEEETPETLVKAWALSEEVKPFLGEGNSNDLLMIAVVGIVEKFLGYPLFIQYIKALQSISRRLRGASITKMTAIESKVLRFLLNRYMAVSPINSILETALEVTTSKTLVKEAYQAAQEDLGRPILGIPVPRTGVTKIVNYLLDVMRLPYAQVGSSLAASLDMAMSADTTILWDDA